MQKKEEEHKAELTRVKEDLARVMKIKEVLKKDLDTVLKEKASLEKERDELKAGLSKRAADDQKIKKMCKDIEAESEVVKSELTARKADNVKWLAKLSSLNVVMDRTLAESASFAFPSSGSKSYDCLLLT